MKIPSVSAAIAATSALLGCVVEARSLRGGAHHQAHQLLHRRAHDAHPAPSSSQSSCGCRTYVTTITGPAGLFQPSTTATTTTSYATVSPTPQHTTSSSAAAAVPSSSSAASIPTPIVTVCPEPGTYTLPASTITLSSTVTASVPASSTVTSTGVYSFAGITTAVTTQTTITCPYSVVETQPSVTRTKVLTTTYVCPSAGTYTLPPTTTAVAVSTVSTYPVHTEYPPGTYTRPATTVTVTETSKVIVCPFTPVAPAPSSSSHSSAPAPTTKPTAPAPTTQPSSAPTSAHSQAPPPPPSAPTSAHSQAPPPPSASSKTSPIVEHPAPSSTHVAPTTPSSSEHKPSSTSASSSAKASASATPHASLGGGKHWGMTYSPYTRDGKCKERADVAKDIAEIAHKGFATVRLYGTDCKGLENVGDAAAQHGLKLVVGVFIDGKGLGAAHEQVQALVAWGRWALVELVVVGNEALFNGYVTAAQLAAFIGEAKQKFRAGGYTGPCTTTEASVKLLHDNRAVLCPVLDVVAANLHPFFNPKVTAAGAGEFVAQELKHLAQVCPGKDSFTLETGWPSGGQPNGAAVPGEAEQRLAIHGIEKAVGGRTIFFTYVNDGWKQPGSFGVEQRFGCGHLF